LENRRRRRLTSSGSGILFLLPLGIGPSIGMPGANILPSFYFCAMPADFAAYRLILPGQVIDSLCYQHCLDNSNP
jgi:hypothetical protein